MTTLAMNFRHDDPRVDPGSPIARKQKPVISVGGNLFGTPLIRRLIIAQFVILMATQFRTQGAPAPTTGMVKTLSAAVASNTPPAPKIVDPTNANLSLPLLQRTTQIRDMSAVEAARGYPARLKGVITYFDPAEYKHFLQDESAGIYIAFVSTNVYAGLEAGQEVEVEGFSGPGGYAPILNVTKVHIIGPGRFPKAEVATVQSLFSGREDAQWVTLKGVIRSQTVERNRIILALWTGDALIQVVVPNATKAPADMVDAAVVIHGVCCTIFNDLRRLTTVQVHVPNWNQIEAQEMGSPDISGIPVQPISRLLEFHSGTSGLHRARTRGVVTLRKPDGSFFLQDESGGILVEPKESTSKIPTGTWVETVSFPAISDKVPVLQDAITQPIESLPAIEPRILMPDSALDDSFHATLVRFDGRVVAHSARPGKETFSVEFANGVTDVILEKEGDMVALPAIAAGSTIRVTGIYIARLDESRQIRSFHLLLRSPEDFVVISRPNWWTLAHSLWVFGGLASVLLGSLTWVSLLRNQVRRRTSELSREVEEHKRTESRLEQKTGLLVAEVEKRKHTQNELEQRQVELEKEVSERKQAEEQLKETHKQLLVVSRQAGMAEVATSVLHNVGNVLNSVNVSSTLVANQVRQSKVGNLAKVCDLIQNHNRDLADFLTNDPKGRQVPGYLNALVEHLDQEQNEMLAELESLRKNIEHIKDIVSMQQSYAKVSGVSEKLKVPELIEDALRMNADALERHNVKVVLDFPPQLPEILIDKSKVLQILVNLVRNAKHACDDSGRPDKQLTLRVANGDNRIKISISDNGIGIPAENLTRIFNHGFTTRRNGHGFGLHSGALAAKELGGSLTAFSNGVGQGATFALEVPTEPQN